MIDVADPDIAVLDGLLAAVRERSGDNTLQWANRPEPLSGGFWAQMWKVEVTTNSRPPGADTGLLHKLVGRPLAARVMPDPQTAARETEVQRYLASAGFATPAVRLAAPPSAELDRAWMLMDFVSGRSMLTDLSGPAALLGLPRLARALPDQLARQAAALHQVDPGPLPDHLGRDGIVTQLENLSRQAMTIERVELARLADRLVAAAPTAGLDSVVCHGDLHPFNILAGPGGETVIDWSAAYVADPHYDLAYTNLMLGNPPLSGPPLLRGVINRAGRFLAAGFLRRYGHHSGHPIDERLLDWFTAVHCLRLLVEVGTWEANGSVDQHQGHPFLGMHELAHNQIRRVVKH